jgi:hypothetical protein
MLITLLPPTSGRARVAGLDIVAQASAVRRVIGYVPQMLSADGTLTGFENLNVFAKLYELPRKERRQRVEAALAFMGLEDSAHKPVRQYSGGMIRRLEIAQSRLHNPRVLFLDEPTIGLDPAARRAVWEQFIAIFHGISVIWERDLGIVHKFLVSPTPRSALVPGKAVSAGLRALTQAAIVYLLALLLGVSMRWNPLALLDVLFTVMLGAAFFSIFSLVIACLVKTRGALHRHRPGADHAPVFRQQRHLPHLRHAGVAAGHCALQPAELPGRRPALAHAGRGGKSSFGLGTDIAALMLVTAGIVTLASRMYPKLAI